MAIDLLIKNGTVITMGPKQQVIEHCDVAIDEGKIIDIKPKITLQAEKTLDASGCTVNPGFINGHSHVYQSLIEGLGYDMHFNPWNWRFLFPVVSQITPEDAEASATLAALEMIRNGVTTISDHWYLHTDLENIYRVWHGKKRTTVAMGPGSTEDISESLMLKVVALSKELDINVSTHVAGWIEINSYTIRHFGERDLEHFHSLGLTGPKGVMFHAVWLSDREIDIMAQTGTKVVHCPIANAYLGYGISPVSHFLSRGITVGLGTDGAASYTYDMLEVARTAGMLQKASKLDAEAVTAEELLEMLTIKGAKVLGIDDEVGSLEIGKRADVIVVDFKKPHLLPVGRWLPKLIYSARGSDVIHTIVDGKVLMESGKVVSMDEEKVLERSLAAREDLIERAGQETRDLLTMPWPKSGPAWRSLVK
jgi:5-methylthioadenosine/S-adenosylhomocysteine deaminase